MKKLLTLVAVVAFAVSAFAQLPVPKAASYSGGSYIASAYNYHTEVYGLGQTTGGTYSITVFAPTVTLADGRVVNPYSTNNSITIGQGANQETVTPSTVTGCGVGQPYRGCTITATFSNGHGKGDQITSGSNGYLEALSDAGNRGGGDVYWEIDCGIITLNTGSATTTTTCNAPKTSVNTGISVYVTTTITTSASYSVGISGHTAYFMSSCTALTAATTCSQFIPAPASNAGGSGTGALLITANATAGAGAVHLKVWGHTGAQSTF